MVWISNPPPIAWPHDQEMATALFNLYRVQLTGAQMILEILNAFGVDLASLADPTAPAPDGRGSDPGGFVLSHPYLDFYRTSKSGKYRILNSSWLFGMKYIYSLAEMLEVDEIILPNKTADCNATWNKVHDCIRQGLSRDYDYQILLEGDQSPEIMKQLVGLDTRVKAVGYRSVTRGGPASGKMTISLMICMARKI